MVLTVVFAACHQNCLRIRQQKHLSNQLLRTRQTLTQEGDWTNYCVTLWLKPRPRLAQTAGLWAVIIWKRLVPAIPSLSRASWLWNEKPEEKNTFPSWTDTVWRRHAKKDHYYYYYYFCYCRIGVLEGKEIWCAVPDNDFLSPRCLCEWGSTDLFWWENIWEDLVLLRSQRERQEGCISWCSRNWTIQRGR